MERREFSPRDLLTASDWTSLLFTTYSLSLSFLESVPLAAVNKSYRDFKVLADLAGYLSSLSEVGAIGVGRDYDLIPVRVERGVFHPKITLLGDADGNVRAMVGSGNLTFGGWGYSNNEVLEVLRPGPDSQCFGAIADMLEAIARQDFAGAGVECMRKPELDRSIELGRKASRVPGEGRSRLLHTMAGPLVDDIAVMALELGGAQRLTVVSPYFSTFTGVQALAGALECEDIEVFVPPRAPSLFGFDGARAAGLRVRPVESDLFDDPRSLHAKFFDIECRLGRLLVSGSANATVQALLGQNVEAVVARPVDVAVNYGWRETTRPSTELTSEAEPEEATGSGLVLDYNGRVIVGWAFSTAPGKWDAYLSWGTRREALGEVEVASDGKFAVDPKLDLVTVGSAAQVILIRGENELRGWLVLRDLIRGSASIGPVARSIVRVLGGFDSMGDIGAILDYFARDPERIIDAADRVGGGTPARKSAVAPPPDGNAGHLRGVSAFDAPEHQTSIGARGEDALVEALLRRLATALPEVEDDVPEEDDSEVPTRRDGKRRDNSGRKGTAQKLQRKPVERAFEIMFRRLDQSRQGPGRAGGLFLLFDMMTGIVPRTEDADELMPKLLERWVSAARGARPEGGDVTALDRCFAIVLTRMVGDRPERAQSMHGVLQTWFGANLTEEQRAASEPKSDSVEALRLNPIGSQDEWSASWSAILATRTQWSTMSALSQAIRSRQASFDMPECVSASERRVIGKQIARETNKEWVVYIDKKGYGEASCSGCRMRLPSLSRSRLRKERIASCQCGRVVIDIAL